MVKIYSFPYAGGSASAFRQFTKEFRSSEWEFVPLEIPGRGKRSLEDFAIDFEDRISRTFDFEGHTSEPYVLHGHCMGALIAYEALKSIERRKVLPPAFLCVSGRNAPSHVNHWARGVAGLGDEALFQELKLVGGTPKGLSYAMAQPFMKVFKEDQRLAREYQPDHARVKARILAIGGTEDSMTSESGLADWSMYTDAEVEVAMMPGEHYFIFDQAQRIRILFDKFSSRENASKNSHVIAVHNGGLKS